MRTTLSLTALSLTACIHTAAEPAPGPGPGPDPVTAAGDCAVEYATRVDRTRGGYQVLATATNRSDAMVTIEMEDRCPSGPIVFTGLPDGYDPYGTCTMGMCAAPEGPVQQNIAPGETIELGAGNVDPAGGTCNVELPAGSYTIGFVAPTLVGGGKACEPVTATLEHAERTTKPCEPMPACGIGCPGPMAKDENGCTLCACAEDPFDF